MALISELGPILLIAALLGILMARLGQPPLLGYLLAGILARQGVVGALWHADTFQALGDLGIVLLLFYLGLELSWHKMAPIAGRSFALLLAVVGLPFLILHNIFLLAGVPGFVAAVMAFILSVCSTAIGAQVLEARGEISSRIGNLFIGVNLFADVLGILIVAIIGLGARSDSSVGTLLLTIAGFTAACATVGVAVIPRFLDWLRENPASRLLLPITLIGIGLMVAYAGHLIGVPITVGAFLAGAVVAESKNRDELEACLHPIKELFLGLFFVAAGFSLDATRLPGLIPYALGLTVVLVLIRFAATTGVAYILGEEPVTALRLAALVLPVSELAFVLISASGLPGEWRDILLGLATLMFLFTAVLLQPLERLAPKFEDRLAHRSAGALRHLLYVLRGAVAPSVSPVASGPNRVRLAFRELVLTLVTLIGLGVGIAGTSNWLDTITPDWLDFRLLGVVLSVAILVPGIYLGWMQWQKLLGALVGPYKTGPGTERIRLIQQATRGALSTLILGLFALAALPIVFTLAARSRLVVLAAVVLAGLGLAFVFRNAVLRLHGLLVSGMWGSVPRAREPAKAPPTPAAPSPASDSSTTPSSSPVEGRTP
jgi:Kef-type K+ transport system membrane component KefB